MITFLTCIALLVGAYFIYGNFVEKHFGADENRPTPAITKQDGVDYVPLKRWKIFLIQFLNIAGLGPIFGAISGALWGPVAFLWIVFGCIFAGAVHDYFSGMLSIRHDGASIPEIVGKYLGLGMKQFMRIFSVVLLILVGVVFVKGPATILNGLVDIEIPILIAVILLATMIPIDKLIGKIYPVFGISLIIMAVGLLINLLMGTYDIPELTMASFTNVHTKPDKFPVFPMLFITIACGAISGFHSTQSPLMARCMSNEKEGKVIFFGAMITEGIVALIWAAAAMAFFGGVSQLGETMAEEGHNAAWVVNIICNTMLGRVGGVLAIFGVVAAPITSGDTAFRSVRIMVADAFNYKQDTIKSRIIVTIPIFIVALLLTQINFQIIWRYFGWSNQVLATIVLWTIVVYLHQQAKSVLLVLIPAMFMTVVVVTFIFVSPEGFGLDYNLSLGIGVAASLILLIVFNRYSKKSSVIQEEQSDKVIEG
ncbi:carbon starvation protein A [Flammeovirga sp. MY04]|uniref:carbon starvation CstA family protein n=1 Tax=Flammeovirga sp. MY04 TaxID=1191459 RepID=UPI0008060C2B|nr:carbon starvation CstA family protein [Flammeovirga sp. MY04]ANQ52293.1 carbon starvation protein A [Flammeovirga sp. MY04]